MPVSTSSDPIDATQLFTRAPLVPELLLRQHACFIPGDTRFRAAARLRQSLWREEQGLPAGLHRPGGSSTITPIPLGSLLQPADAARGLNFFNPAVYAFVRRSLILREEGAMVNYDRLTRNLLSSEPLTYNLFVPLALNLDLATAVFRRLLPAFVHQVTGIRFETSPGRYDPRYLRDGTAADAALSVITPDGVPATLFIEVKYSEGCTGPAATHRPRYDEASREVALHHDPDAPALRSTLLEQFWRLHLLAQLAVHHEVTPRAHLLVLYPHRNRRVRTATRLYATELLDPAGSSSPGTVGFTTLPLETFVTGLAQAGGGAEAAYLHHRYLDLSPVLDLVLAESNAPDEPPPAAPLLALPPPSSLATTVPSTPSVPGTTTVIAEPQTAAPRPSSRSRSAAAAVSPPEVRSKSSGRTDRTASVPRPRVPSSVNQSVKEAR